MPEEESLIDEDQNYQRQWKQGMSKVPLRNFEDQICFINLPLSESLSLTKVVEISLLAT
jgi:hypothetical protein